MNQWYKTLERPPLTPPNWIFSPVWTLLYAMIATAVVLYYRSRTKPHVRMTTLLLVLHLSANFAWTYFFFGLRSPFLALIDILLLDVTLAILINFFWRVNKLAAAMLLPYCAWVLFATYLNFGFYRLN